jgi:serine/threonine protein kinase
VQHDGRDLVLKELAVTDRAFVRECERLDKLRHRFIVPLECIFFPSPSRACLVMPFYPRGNLRAWVDEHKGLGASRAAVRTRMHTRSSRLSPFCTSIR